MAQQLAGRQAHCLYSHNSNAQPGLRPAIGMLGPRGCLKLMRVVDTYKLTYRLQKDSGQKVAVKMI